MNFLWFWKGAVFDSVIDEGFTEASIGHDEFQVNKCVFTQLVHSELLQVVEYCSGDDDRNDGDEKVEWGDHESGSIEMISAEISMFASQSSPSSPSSQHSRTSPLLFLRFIYLSSYECMVGS